MSKLSSEHSSKWLAVQVRLDQSYRKIRRAVVRGTLSPSLAKKLMRKECRRFADEYDAIAVQRVQTDKSLKQELAAVAGCED